MTKRTVIVYVTQETITKLDASERAVSIFRVVKDSEPSVRTYKGVSKHALALLEAACNANVKPGSYSHRSELKSWEMLERKSLI